MTNSARHICHATLLTALAVGAGACRSQKEGQFAPTADPRTESVGAVIGVGPCGGADRSGTIASEKRIGEGAQRLTGTATPAAPAPKAMAYRLGGAYGGNVAVTLTPDGKQLASYPAPSDITPSTAPVALANGWWLSRSGISPNSRFTRYTREEYAALPAAPTAAQLLDAVIAGSAPVALTTLPMSLTEALADTAAVNRLLEGAMPGLPGRE